ncbi:MAG TPA: murein biosynthesis integral membrane protein MurJ [Moraxellaceae bacterium]|nr:murein biosynthesis integral membrane protein MurJ [Moraxellaceae bacterium]
MSTPVAPLPESPAADPQKKGSSLWRSTFVVSAMTMLSRIAGLVRDMVYMNLFGANLLMDAFLVAFKIPNFLRRLFAEGAFAQAFVPVLSEVKAQRGDAAVKLLVDRVAGTLSTVLGSITVLAMLASPLIITLFAPGFRDDPFKFDLTAQMLRITFPYLLLISLTAFAGGILNSYHRFGASAFAPVLMNLIMIAFALWVSPLMTQPVVALAWGVLISGIVQLGFQVPYLREIRMVPRFRLDFDDPDVKRILGLMVPAMFGVSVSQVNLLLDTILATFLVTGSVSWLYTAERLTELPLGLIGIAVATVILPSLSAKYAEKSHDEFTAMLDWALRVIVMVGLPSSIAMGILSEPLIAALFLHGKFTANDVAKSAAALQALSGGILAFMLIKVFAPGYFSRQDTRTPVKIGITAMIANMGFNLILVLGFHMAHVGLSLASTLSAFLNAGLLYWGLHKRGVYRIRRHWVKLGLRYLGANAVMAVLLLYITPATAWWMGHDHAWLKVAALLGICTAGAGAYFAALFAFGFRLREIHHH